MRRISPIVSHGSTRRLASAVALALSLAGGSAVLTAATATPALAQRQQKPEYSPAFVQAYTPVAAIVNAEGGDIAAAKAQLPTVLATVQTPDDRYNAGNLALLIGNKLKDPVLQRQGLELMVQSGKVDPAQIGQFQSFIGGLAYDAKDWAAARTALQAAVAAGFTQDNPEALIAESYFQEGLNQQGLNYLKGLIESRRAAGQTVPDAWVLRGLQVAYQAKLGEAANDWSAMLVAHNPTSENWLKALQVVNAVNSLEPQVQLDLLRLMAVTGSLSERREFVSYIEAADPRIMSNEVAKVLDAGVQKGVFSPGDEYYTAIKDIVDQRAAEDRADAPALAARARSGTARDAQNAGDVFLSIGSFAEAEQMFNLALEKGGGDRDQLLTRLGISQAQQGKMAEARATFEQVSGTRAAVARMWAAYVESRA
jgi:tetratricopeptide (TPR) repeat protein